tara:strand:+ start:12631 stop:12870 length:240 start_codon:yes stop_codon:yes gene_type:complete
MGAKNCPICGDDYEFYEEMVDEGDGKGIQMTHDIDRMWEVEKEVRWNRICHRIGTKGGRDSKSNRLFVETFRHHYGEKE